MGVTYTIRPYSGSWPSCGPQRTPSDGVDLLKGRILTPEHECWLLYNFDDTQVKVDLFLPVGASGSVWSRQGIAMLLVPSQPPDSLLQQWIPWMQNACVSESKALVSSVICKDLTPIMNAKLSGRFLRSCNIYLLQLIRQHLSSRKTRL